MAVHKPSPSLMKALGTTFDIDPSRYDLLKSAGKGAFGVVVAAHDAQRREVVAVKKIGHVFDNSTSAKRVLRELKLMRHLRHPNVCGISDLPIALPLLHAVPASSNPRDVRAAAAASAIERPAAEQAARLLELDSIYLACEYMDTDLHSVIVSSQNLGDKYLQFFMWQMMKGLAYLHACNVLHRDVRMACGSVRWRMSHVFIIVCV